MEDRQSHFRLGLFVIVTVVILFGVLFVLGGRALFQPMFIFETYFDKSVAGLELGAPVKFRGVPLGEVVEITTSSNLYERNLPLDRRKGYIVVRAKITSQDAGQTEQFAHDVAEHVRIGARAQTQLAGITGQQYLALDMLDPAKHPPLAFDWKPRYPYVPSAPSLAGEIVENAQKFLASLNEADVKSLGQNLNALIVNVNRKVDELPVQDLSAEAKQALDEVRAAVQRIDRVVARAPVEQAVANFSSAAGRLDTLLADPGIKQTVDNSAAFTARVRAFAESGELDRILRNLDEAIERTNAMLGDNQYDVRVIVRDLRVTADNLRALSETAKRYPAGILIGGPPEKVDLNRKESK